MESKKSKRRNSQNRTIDEENFSVLKEKKEKVMVEKIEEGESRIRSDWRLVRLTVLGQEMRFCSRN